VRLPFFRTPVSGERGEDHGSSPRCFGGVDGAPARQEQGGRRVPRLLSFRLIFAGDQTMCQATSSPVWLLRRLRSSAASRHRRTVGLTRQGGLVLDRPGPKSMVTNDPAQYIRRVILASHAGSIGENFITTDSQARDKGFPKVDELRCRQRGQVAQRERGVTG
jgi:hypothetical protein